MLSYDNIRHRKVLKLGVFLQNELCTFCKMDNQIDIRVDTAQLKRVVSKKTYVCWIDIMGTKDTMLESIEKASNFILRFHSFCIKAIKNKSKVKCYPLMDGAFITSTDFSAVRTVIASVFKDLAEVFLTEDCFAHQFVVRGAIAYGDIVHGGNITDEICTDIANEDSYKSSLLFGLPMIQAYKSENEAPPFGIYIHESARTINGLQGRYYAWCNEERLRNQLKENLTLYFNWCEKFSNYLKLDNEKINVYKKKVDEFFSNRNTTKDNFI